MYILDTQKPSNWWWTGWRRQY